MAPKFQDIRERVLRIVKHRRTRKAALWIVGIVIAIGILGALVAPPLVRYKLTEDLSKSLHREVSIRQVRINPYSLSLWVRGFLMKSREGAETAASFDELYVNLELLSLFYRGIVLKEARLVNPYVHVIRNEDLTYNFSDVIEESTEGPPAPTPRFSLNNLEIVDGSVDFDNLPEGVRHSVTEVRIGVPFVSSLPYFADVKVEPAFAAVIDGAPIQITGETKPFKESRQSSFHFEIDTLRIPKYLEYSPVDLEFEVPSGEMVARIHTSFQINKNSRPALVISGQVELRDLILQEDDDSPLLKIPSLELVVGELDLFGKSTRIEAIKVQQPELHLTRYPEDQWNISGLVGGAESENDSGEEENGTLFSWQVEEILLNQGTLHFTDVDLERPFGKRLKNIRIRVNGLANEPETKAAAEIAFQSEEEEHFNHKGTLQLTPFSAEGKIEWRGLPLKGLAPYYQRVVAADITDGVIHVDTRYALDQKQNELDAKLFHLNAELESFRLELPDTSEPLWQIPLLALKDTTVDIGKRSVVIGSFEGRGGKGFLRRETDGTFSHARLLRARSSGNQAPQTGQNENFSWKFEMKRLALERFGVIFEDQSLNTPGKIVLSELTARGENFSSAKDAQGNITIRTQINKTGSIHLTGTAGTNPAAGRFGLEAQEIELLPFQPYLEDYLNFVLTAGKGGANGTLSFDTAGEGSVKVRFAGDLQVVDFGSVEKTGADDLIKWKSLDLDGIRFAMQPITFHADEVTLADFYSRVVIRPDGQINLQNLIAQEKGGPGENLETGDVETPSVEATESSAPQITIGKVNLRKGEVKFSDFFIKPNYSANLSDVHGTVSEIKPEDPGNLQLRATINKAASLQIDGEINPLAKNLYFDIKASAMDIELSPLTPYSSNYIGYGIEKGKLSFDVRYRVKDRKLSAENDLVLNQLTFGKKTDSPTATKLPVLFALELLKDRNGVINVDLPISGSLDNPEFSVGGIIFKIIVKIILKTATSPFAFLSSVFGGGEDLSYIEFEYGQATLTEAAEKRLETLATALNNRPALQLEIRARVDPEKDLEALKSLAVKRKVKAQKLKELVEKGTAPQSVDDIRIESEEYARLLAAAYAAESFPKPQKAEGISVPEMEKLLRENAEVTQDDLRELANRRARVVRDFFLESGKVKADRLFIVASIPASGEVKDKVKDKDKDKGSRVDFSLK